MLAVQARGAPRQNATAKDSEWVRTRQALEKDTPDDVNEVSNLEHAAWHSYKYTTNNFRRQWISVCQQLLI